MKRILFVLAMLVSYSGVWACASCRIAQPRYFKDISHGAGPESNWDLLIISVTAVIVIFTLYFSIKWLVRPGEKSASHIKRSILNFDYEG